MVPISGQIVSKKNFRELEKEVRQEIVEGLDVSDDKDVLLILSYDNVSIILSSSIEVDKPFIPIIKVESKRTETISVIEYNDSLKNYTVIIDQPVDDKSYQQIIFHTDSYPLFNLVGYLVKLSKMMSAVRVRALQEASLSVTSLLV